MKHTKSYQPNHPNPQFSREDFVNLNGKWDFCFDDENKGIEKKYFNKFPAKYQIEVPFTYEYPSSGINEKATHNIVWYKKNYIHHQTSKRTILHFDGVDYIASVYVNGQFVGEHTGAYSGFSFDITDQLVEGDNSIVLRAYDDYSCVHARGKQRWMDHNYECFYVEQTGIWKTVWIERVAPTYLKRVTMDPSYKTTSLSVEFEVNGLLEGCDIETIIRFDNLLISRSMKTITRPIFSEVFDIASDNATMKLHCWSHYCPNLYDIEFNIFKNGILIDTVRSYFGVAEYASKGNAIYLNRNSLYPRLILNQGYYEGGGLTPTENQIIQDINLMKDIGLNGNRVHQKIESSLFYYYCDILGFYVWQELPSAYEWRNITPINMSKEWVDVLLEHHNHPSIMSEVIVNESWGTMSIRDHKEQQNFATGLYYLTKSIEKNRFVISNDGWEHTESDLITVHNYNSSYEQLMDTYDIDDNDFRASHRYVATGNKTLLCEKHEFDDKPVLLSEFAGIAFSRDKDIGWGYGDLVKNEEEYLNRLKGQIDAIFDSGLFCGFCITQLSDVQQEVNGLVNEKREYKADKEKLKEIISRLY